jgi:hypothetical protein
VDLHNLCTKRGMFYCVAYVKTINFDAKIKVCLHVVCFIFLTQNINLVVVRETLCAPVECGYVPLEIFFSFLSHFKICFFFRKFP